MTQIVNHNVGRQQGAPDNYHLLIFRNSLPDYRYFYSGGFYLGRIFLNYED